MIQMADAWRENIILNMWDKIFREVYQKKGENILHIKPQILVLYTYIFICNLKCDLTRKSAHTCWHSCI